MSLSVFPMQNLMVVRAYTIYIAVWVTHVSEGMIVTCFPTLTFKILRSEHSFLRQSYSSEFPKENGPTWRKHKSVSFGELQKIAAGKSVARVGATENPQQRAGQYAREGYSGQMYKFKTQNMRKAEDKLLQQSAGTHNVQERSNAPDEPGYVYALKGRKYK